MPKHVEIPVGDQVALVDAGDAALVSKHRWRVMRRGHTLYAVFGVRRDGRMTTVLMHRLILGTTAPDTQVDHRSGDGLDNRRANLRASSRSENHRNTRTRADNHTGLKGVGFSKRLQRYTARIFVDGRAKYLGSYITPEEAHAAYCRAAQEHFKDFARFQ